MRSIATEIDIAAAPERVWEVLMDFAAYPDWNPMITSISGDPATGSRLEARLEPPGIKPMTIKPTVTAVDPGRLFQWLGKTGVRGVFDGRHTLRLIPSENGTRFEHFEEFTGLLAGPIHRWIGERTEAGFGPMNESLKARAEAG